MIFDNFKPALIIFDKDGTLLDFDQMWGGWALEIARRLEQASGKPLIDLLSTTWGFDPITKHVEPDGELAGKTLAYLHDLTLNTLRADGFNGDAAARVVAAAWHLPDSMSLVRPISNLQSLFSNLHSRNIKIAIATLDDRAPTQTTFAELGMLKYVDALVCADDGVQLKPAPDMILKVCSDLNIQPSHCMMIGDSVSDLQMGRNARVGMTVGVLTGLSNAEKLKPYADHILNSVEQLL